MKCVPQGVMLIAVTLWAYWLYAKQPGDRAVLWSVYALGGFGAILALMVKYYWSSNG
jgi:hypothetical protein